MDGIVQVGLNLVVATGVREYTKTIIETYIKPKLESKYKESELNKKLDLVEDKFNEYMERTYNNNLYMSTIVFKNQQKTVNDLYIPLTVSKYCSENNKEKCEICINKYSDNFIPYHKKILLVDNAGMGKSTILKYLYLSVITENKGIPILIELRKLVNHTSIIDFIMNEINGIKKYFDKEEILDLIEGGGFIFFFDGYDEVIDEFKNEVTENLEDFISKTSTPKELNNNYIISSRDESSLNCFSDFQRFDIKALTKEEAYELIGKYDNDGELSKELIKKLESEENLKIIDEFLVNPLMVSLLYTAFEYKRKVPYKKHIFYRQVYDALFEDHDRAKGGAYVHPKKSKLDIEDCHRILRALGFITLSKGISYCKEELIEMISKAKRMSPGIYFKENDFINDIIYSVPLFVKEGIEYRWAHKSFQEYFAASYICFDSKEKQNKYLTTMIENEKISKYYNVLDFCYDIDYKKFREIIIYPFIKEFIEYYDNSYISDKYKNYDLKNLDIRRNINFIYNEIFIKIFNNQILNSQHIDRDDPLIEFELAFENWKLFRNKESRCSIHHKKDFQIAVGFFSKNKNVNIIINLLISKKSLLIKDSLNLRHSRSDLLKQIKENLGYKEYTLNREDEDILSEQEIFYLINDFLIDAKPSNRRSLKYLFDYDECVKFKNKIEEEISLEEEIFL